ncbi:MAG: glycosyltransferase family 4 protein [Alphaproteobacteria bacterium]|nr:glycosyltransferase family 4 protein [Alphaproteobacteria bacterium]
MSDWGQFAAVATTVGVASCVGTRALIPLLRRRDMLDRPNERSSHEIPTPRGGGIAPIAAVLIAWTALNQAIGYSPATMAIPILASLLAIVSWIDDVRTLPPALRLVVQLPAVTLGLFVLPQPGVFQGWLGPALDRAFAGLVWLWFINLFNFMDGIDGIAGSETAAIALGLLVFAAAGVGFDPGQAALAACILGAALGFLVWNWAPAQIFLGDVGSVPLGYLLGYLLLDLAARGRWKIALVLPLYFLADATITLIRRLLRGERVWQAHRQHFYQRAVQRGWGHAAVVRRVIAADAGLIACGWAAENGLGLWALAAAGAIVALLLWDLTRVHAPARAKPALPGLKTGRIPASRSIRKPPP